MIGEGEFAKLKLPGATSAYHCYSLVEANATKKFAWGIEWSGGECFAIVAWDKSLEQIRLVNSSSNNSFACVFQGKREGFKCVLKYSNICNIS